MKIIQCVVTPIALVMVSVNNLSVNNLSVNNLSRNNKENKAKYVFEAVSPLAIDNG